MVICIQWLWSRPSFKFQCPTSLGRRETQLHLWGLNNTCLREPKICGCASPGWRVLLSALRYDRTGKLKHRSVVMYCQLRDPRACPVQLELGLRSSSDLSPQRGFFFFLISSQVPSASPSSPSSSDSGPGVSMYSLFLVNKSFCSGRKNWSSK